MSRNICKFRAYGENSATFILFQAIAMCPGAVVHVLLANLKQFGTGKKARWNRTDEPEVWLFPSFGKQYGFGEPDALVLAGRFAFWFEVETTINCKSGLPALRRSLIQLWRFRLFDAALKQPPVVRNGGKRIVGVTLNDAREERDAALRLKGHGVLQRIYGRLKAAESHYVLFTTDKPKGEGGSGQGYAQVLERERAIIVNGYSGLPLLEKQNCWYAYWKKDLAGKFCEYSHTTFDLDEAHVRIKRLR